MFNSIRKLLGPTLLALFLVSVAWIYFESARTLEGKSARSLVEAAYPLQFMPMVVDKPAPTPTPSPTSTPAPLPILHVGLQLQWDGEGEVHIEGYYWYPGTHENKEVDQQVDADSVRVTSNFWYSPNPFNWPSENWTCHFNAITNRVETCSNWAEDSSEWKWGYGWILPADLALGDGDTLSIDGQKFSVTGPITYLTGYGVAEQAWRLVNQEEFLYWHDGGEWKQYVEPGDAILIYEATDKRLLLFSSVERTYYKNDNWTGDHVRYVEYLNQLNGLMSGPIEDSATYLSEHVQTTENGAIDSAVDFLERKGINPASVAPGLVEERPGLRN